MNKQQYIQKICETVASKSVCSKAKVGAVFTNEDFEILSTGYNGTARGMPHCDVLGHKEGEANHIHAEVNAINTAAKNGTKISGSFVFVTHMPCRLCMMLLINLRVRRVYIKSEYGEKASVTLKGHYMEKLKLEELESPIFFRWLP